MRGARAAFGSLTACLLAFPLACNAILGIQDVTLGPDAGRDAQGPSDRAVPPDPGDDASDTGMPVPGPSDVHVALMHASTCARKREGSVFCFGSNTLGQVGSDASQPQFASPEKVLGLNDAVTLAAGYDHVCALKLDRTVVCWGYNHFGQLGAGNLQNMSPRPVAVSGLRNVATLAGGTVFTCATKMDGTAACWGANYAGQLGNGTKTDTASPVPVFQLTDAVAIGAGEAHACALRKGGTVVCWGSNAQGQLGGGTTGESLVPVPVPSLKDVASIAVGGTFSCALLRGGGVVCWGGNSKGELGNGTTTTTPDLTPVSALGDAAAIAAGYAHACALKTGGKLVCWGTDDHGELGDGFGTPDANTSVSTPVAVKNVTNAIGVVTGGEHSCATTKDERILCWGANASGQVGDGTTTDALVPVGVVGF